MKESYIYCNKYQEYYNFLNKQVKEEKRKIDCNKDCRNCEYQKIVWVEED